MKIMSIPGIQEKTSLAKFFGICITATGMLTTLAYAEDGMIIDANGYVGIGTSSPQRLMHVRGSNAVFRMDRPIDNGAGASFFLVGTTSSNMDEVLQAFQVGTINTDGGSFIVNDTGNLPSGYGINRMKIVGNGDVYFGESERRNVYAASFIEQSSEKYKKDITPLKSPLESLQQIRGVRFKWKESNKASIGFIAEEIGEVFPEVVSYDESGEVAGMNYSALTAVLLEAIKVQQIQLNALQATLADYRTALKQQEGQLQNLQMLISLKDHTDVGLTGMNDLVELTQHTFSKVAN